MTDNIFDYINWRGDLSFRQSPFNEVDGAILAKLSYLPLERVLELLEMAGLKAERIFDSDTGKEVTATTGKFCIAARKA